MAEEKTDEPEKPVVLVGHFRLVANGTGTAFPPEEPPEAPEEKKEESE